MLQVKQITKKTWIHTAMEKELNTKITALAKKLDKPKCEVLNALVTKGLSASRRNTKTKR